MLARQEVAFAFDAAAWLVRAHALGVRVAVVQGGLALGRPRAAAVEVSSLYAELASDGAAEAVVAALAQAVVRDAGGG